MSRGIRKYSIVLRQGERIGRDDADVRLDVDERLRVEVLRIDDGVVDVGEDLELVGDADVVAVRRHAVRDDAGARLALDERLDHPVLERHALDPRVGFDGHQCSRRRKNGQSGSVSRHAQRLIDVASAGSRSEAAASSRMLRTIEVVSGK